MHGQIVNHQLVLERVEVEINSTHDYEPVCKAITAGYFYNTAKRNKKISTYYGKHRTKSKLRHFINSTVSE